jgi:hypothetical protein
MYMRLLQASAARAGKSTRRRKDKPRAKAARPVVQAALGPDGMLQQEVLLAPYTGSLDLLHLSTAARWLKPYRFHLGSLCLRLHQDLSGNTRKFLKMATSLLGMQQRLRRLRIEAGRFVVPALTAIKSGVSQGKTLQSLDIAALLTPLNQTECEGLSAALISGACPALTVFQTSGKHLTGEELRCFAATIRAGGLRQLRELILAASGEYCGRDRGDRGTGGRRLPHAHQAVPQRLRLTHAGFAALERAVRGGSLSGLQAITLERCGDEPGAAAGLVEALAEGGCPSLQPGPRPEHNKRNAWGDAAAADSPGRAPPPPLQEPG